MATYYILCSQRTGLPLENVTSDMDSTQKWAVSGRIWENKEHAEEAARNWACSNGPGDDPVMLRTVEL